MLVAASFITVDLGSYSLYRKKFLIYFLIEVVYIGKTIYLQNYI